VKPLTIALFGAMLAAAVPVAGAPVAAADPPQNFVIQEPPQPVPDVQFKDEAGRPHSLAEFHGKTVLLNIWATWCIPCRKEMPTLDRLQAELGGPDFEVITLSIDRNGPDVVKKFYAETGVQHLALRIDVSGEVSRALGTPGLPTTLLIDRQGLEIGRLVGPADWAAPETIAYFRSIIAQRAGAAPAPKQKEKRS
jgi:thiol-disulfide isomerase/thioredoxin